MKRDIRVNRAKKKLKRKRQVRRNLILIGLSILVIIYLISSAVKNRNSEEEQSKTGKQQTEQSEEIKKDGLTLEEQSILAKESAKHAGAPDGILELVDKNPETIDFVANYAVMKDVAPAETVGEVEEGTIPHFLQWDERWGYQSYGESTVAASGCGPTCLSMVIVGLTGDVTATPYALAKYSESNGYIDENDATYWAFMEFAAAKWGLNVVEAMEDEYYVSQELAAGHPIICSVAPGDFTDIGHFIVLTGYEDGVVTVKDPFSIKNTEKTWIYEEIHDQISGIWIYSVE